MNHEPWTINSTMRKPSEITKTKLSAKKYSQTAETKVSSAAPSGSSDPHTGKVWAYQFSEGGGPSKIEKVETIRLRENVIDWPMDASNRKKNAINNWLMQIVNRFMPLFNEPRNANTHANAMQHMSRRTTNYPEHRPINQGILEVSKSSKPRCSEADSTLELLWDRL